MQRNNITDSGKAPARVAVSYKVHSAMGDYDISSQLLGKPTPQLDHNWLAYLQREDPYLMQRVHMVLMQVDSAIRLSREEFEHYHNEGILLGDGSGYIATTTAFHHLHCIISLTRLSITFSSE